MQDQLPQSEGVSMPQASGHETSTRGVVPGRNFFLALAALVFCAAGNQPITAGTLLFNESFQNSSAPGWTFTGNASLTGGASDPKGAGLAAINE
jgi:hypothetical protein